MAPRPKFCADEIAEYCRKNTIADAMLAFGCSRSTVTNACESHGVPMLSKPTLVCCQIAQWVKENNASISEAVLHFGATRNRVGQACTEAGVKARRDVSDYNPPVARSTFEILAMLLQGYGGTEIAEEFGVSRQRISQIKQRATEARLIGDGAVIIAVRSREDDSAGGFNE